MLITTPDAWDRSRRDAQGVVSRRTAMFSQPRCGRLTANEMGLSTVDGQQAPMAEIARTAVGYLDDCGTRAEPAPGGNDCVPPVCWMTPPEVPEVDSPVRKLWTSALALMLAKVRPTAC